MDNRQYPLTGTEQGDRRAGMAISVLAVAGWAYLLTSAIQGRFRWAGIATASAVLCVLASVWLRHRRSRYVNVARGIGWVCLAIALTLIVRDWFR